MNAMEGTRQWKKVQGQSLEWLLFLIQKVFTYTEQRPEGIEGAALWIHVFLGSCFQGRLSSPPAPPSVSLRTFLCAPRLRTYTLITLCCLPSFSSTGGWVLQCHGQCFIHLWIPPKDQQIWWMNKVNEWIYFLCSPFFEVSMNSPLTLCSF